ncbi:hypothetical protein JTB14_023644 [Gonioctena quinquepunctata]|nr:hypothetical protein JTB14_023644 [Gonioctena quinquepunctata]
MQNEAQVPIETESDKISEIGGEVDSSRENEARRPSRVKKSVVMEDFVTFSAFEIVELPASAVQEATWLKYLEKEILCGAENRYHARSKHIDVRHHFIREEIAQGFPDLRYLGTEEMLADLFTKPVNGAEHFKCLEKIGLGM